MKKRWLKPLGVSVLTSLTISACFFAVLWMIIHHSGFPTKLQLIARVARILALPRGTPDTQDRDRSRVQYSTNLALFGPIPEDGSGVLGRLWVVDADGQSLASSTTNPVPRDAIPLLTQLDRALDAPVKFKVGSFPHKTQFFLMPIPGQPTHTLVIHDLQRGPVRTWVKSLMIAVLVSTLLISLTTWKLLAWMFQQRSRDVRTLMQRMAAGELSARLPVDQMERSLGLPEDFNQMANEIELLVQKVRQIEASKLQLIRNLAHDLRTPLTSLRTAAEALYQNRDKLETRDFESLTQVTYSESIYLGRLVEDLLFMAELKSQDPIKKPLELVSRARTIIEQRQILLKNSNLKLTLHAEHPELHHLISDLHWSRLLTNLLENSERHAESEVNVRINAQEDGFRLEVLDDGPGLSQDQLEKYGIERFTEARGAGSSMRFGLGAVIIRSLIESSGGTLTVRNRIEGGLHIRADFNHSQGARDGPPSLSFRTQSDK
jgi:signal transduction histidine kinase